MEDSIVATAMDLGTVGVLLLVLWKWSQKMFTVVENNTEVMAEFKASNQHHEAGAIQRADAQREVAKEQTGILRGIDQRTARCGLVKADNE